VEGRFAQIPICSAEFRIPGSLSRRGLASLSRRALLARQIAEPRAVICAKRLNPELSYESLTTYLDAACSREGGQEAAERRSAARSIFKDFYCQIEQDLRIVRGRSRTEDQRAKATKRLLSFYRLLFSRQDKPQNERDRRAQVLAEIEAEAALRNIQVRLRLWRDEFTRAVLLSGDPPKTMARILNGETRRGRPATRQDRDFSIAANVMHLITNGWKHDEACREVAGRVCLSFEAVRNIYSEVPAKDPLAWKAEIAGHQLFRLAAGLPLSKKLAP